MPSIGRFPGETALDDVIPLRRLDVGVRYPGLLARCHLVQHKSQNVDVRSCVAITAFGLLWCPNGLNFRVAVTGPELIKGAAQPRLLPGAALAADEADHFRRLTRFPTTLRLKTTEPRFLGSNVRVRDS